MLAWKVGRFSFAPTSREAPTTRKSIAAYLLEATRLEDESARAEMLDLPSSRRRPELRLATTALGGPRSTLEDVAPPSSRGPLDALDRRLSRNASSAPGTFAARLPSDGPVSISEATPSVDRSIRLESAPPSDPAERRADPPSLRSLARASSRALAASAPETPGAPWPPPRPLAPPRIEGAAAPEEAALARGAGAKPALTGAPGPRAPSRPPRPPPRQETTTKKR
jgi:hypothetical protein